MSATSPSDDIATAVSKVLEAAIERVTRGGSASIPSAGGATRLLFPNGIELLYLKLNITKDIGAVVAIAGKDAPLKVETPLESLPEASPPRAGLLRTHDATMATTTRFADIVSLMDTLTGADPNIGLAPHQAFWRGVTRDRFVSIQTDPWGVPGPLVTLGDPTKSNLFLALSGIAPFDGTAVPQMPDLDDDAQGRHATADELARVADWIRNGAPA